MIQNLKFEFLLQHFLTSISHYSMKNLTTRSIFLFLRLVSNSQLLLLFFRY